MRRAGAFLLTVGAVRAQQSALDPAGSEAHRILSIGAIFFWLLGGIFFLVVALLLIALFRRRRYIPADPQDPANQPSQATEQKLLKVVGAATGTTVLILFGLVVLSVSAGRSTARILDASNALTLEVTGNQWWWHIRYVDSDPSQTFVTANEMHIPVGRPILIRGTSHDVIHSFWVPNLQGKRDLIPSRINTLTFRADRPGYYRGQCAEFCGLQHAHMALWVVAEPEADFQAWKAHQLQPGTEPANDATQRGRQVFMEHACTFCHAIQGTNAQGQVGPDLTHFGSRLTIAAGTLRNNRGNLGGWLVDPQNIKPGTHMATVALDAEDLQPLLEYLESLR